MLNRRRFLEGALAASLMSGASSARADIKCKGPFFSGGQGYKDDSKDCHAWVKGYNSSAEVEAKNFEKLSSQEKSQWCWAACISNVFKVHGYDVPQGDIVSKAYGGLDDLPSFGGGMITWNFSKTWTDRGGQKFSTKVEALYDADGNVYQLDNTDVIQAMTANQPLVVGTAGHAVVQTEFEWIGTKDRFDHVKSVTVFDPWPGRGYRKLAPEESLAAVHRSRWGGLQNTGGLLRYVAWPKITPTD